MFKMLLFGLLSPMEKSSNPNNLIFNICQSSKKSHKLQHRTVVNSTKVFLGKLTKIMTNERGIDPGNIEYCLS